MFYNARRVRKRQNHAMVKAEIEKQNAGQSFLQNPYVKNGIIVVCMIADMATLYSIFELQMTEQQILTVIITIVIAGALNIAPVLLALCLNDQEDRSGLKKMQMAAFSGVFLILFISTAILRWTSRQELFASETGIVISGVQDTGGAGSAMTDGVLQGQPFQDMEPENIELREVRPKNTDPQDGQVQNAEPQDGRVQNIESQDGQVQNTGPQDSQAPGAAFQDQPPQAVWLQNIQPRRTAVQETDIQGVTMAQNACALILLLEPLATSAVCLGLSFEKDPQKNKRQLLRLQNVRLRQQRDEYQVQIAELEQELSECDLEEYDREQYETMRQQIELYRQYFKIHARRRLAEKDGTANAATLLLEESKLVQAIGGMKL